MGLIDWAEASATASRRRRCSVVDDIDRRAARAKILLQFGELSSARQALEGATLGPGNDATFAALRNPTKQPPLLREPLSPEMSEFRQVLVDFDEHRFG